MTFGVPVFLIFLATFSSGNAVSEEESCDQLVHECLNAIKDLRTVRELIPWAEDFDALCVHRQSLRQCIANISTGCSTYQSFYQAIVVKEITSNVCSRRSVHLLSKCATDMSVRQAVQLDIKSTCADKTETSASANAMLSFQCDNPASNTWACLQQPTNTQCGSQVWFMYFKAGRALVAETDNTDCNLLLATSEYLYSKTSTSIPSGQIPPVQQPATDKETCDNSMAVCVQPVQNFRTISEALPWAEDFDDLCSCSQRLYDCLDDIPTGCRQTTSYYLATLDRAIVSHVCAQNFRPALENAKCATRLAPRQTAQRRTQQKCNPDNLVVKRKKMYSTKCSNKANLDFSCLYQVNRAQCGVKVQKMISTIWQSIAPKGKTHDCQMLQTIADEIYDRQTNNV